MGNKPWRPKGLTLPTADSDVVGRSPEEIYFAGVDDAVNQLKRVGHYQTVYQNVSDRLVWPNTPIPEDYGLKVGDSGFLTFIPDKEQ